MVLNVFDAIHSGIDKLFDSPEGVETCSASSVAAAGMSPWQTANRDAVSESSILPNAIISLPT
jgi:hypothetical protein